MKRVLMSILAVLFGAIFLSSAFFTYQTYRIARTMNSATSAGMAEAENTQCPRQRLSKLATKYLDKLHGIEIGASNQNAFNLKRSINVDFSDEQGGNWQDKSCEPAVVNIVALGDDLPFKDGTLDYVLSSHVVEHFFDPIKALKEWHRVIKAGGYIFIIAPHKDRTFDINREVTPLAELADRHTGKIKVLDYAAPKNTGAIESYFKKTGKPMAGKQVSIGDLPHLLIKDRANTQLEVGWEYFKEDDHVHHWSVWRTDDFAALVKSLNFNIVEIQDVDDKVGNGFTIVIKK